MPTTTRTRDVARRFAGLSCTNVLDVLRDLGYMRVYMERVRTLVPGYKMAGRAVTVRFLPERPDLAAGLKRMSLTPEYRAFERAGPGDVVVLAALGLPFASVGGDIKFLRLKERGAAGIVTDGALRDVESLRGYGLGLFAQNPTAKAGPTEILPAEENVPVACGGVLVNPGDILVGDDDGVVVVPGQLAEEVLAKTLHKAAIEEFIKERVVAENASPSKYYPPGEETERLFAEAKRKRGRGRRAGR